MRPVKRQYDMSTMTIWLLVPGELNGNILKLLSRKELIGIKSASKSTKSTIKSEKGKIFNKIGEQLKKIIKEGQFKSVPNKHKFKVQNWVKFGPQDEVGYIVKTTKKHMFVVVMRMYSKLELMLKEQRLWVQSVFVHSLGRSKRKCSIGVVGHP